MTYSKRSFFRGFLYAWLISATVIAGKGQTPVQDQQPQRDLTEKSLEELMKIEVATVFSASKSWQKVTDAPSSVSIVTSDEIRKYGYRTLAEVLRSVRGFYVTNDRNYSYLGARGFARPGDYNTRILLLVDGHRMNDNIYDQAAIGTELPIDLDLIDRVEIVRGPSSSLYGTSAFFAVVNLITKRGRDVKRMEVSTEAASFGTSKTRFSYGNKFTNGLEMLFSGSFYDSRGPRRLYIREFDDPATNNGIAENADDDRQKSFFANVSFRNFTLRGVYGAREKGIPTAPYGTVFNDPRTRTTDRRGYLDLKYERTLKNQIGILARVSYDVFRYDGSYVYDISEDDAPRLAINRDRGRGEWWGGELQLTKTLLHKHGFTFGTEYRNNLRQNQENFQQDPYFMIQDDRRKSQNAALYLQDEFAVLDKLTLNAGLRYDHNTNFGGTLKPRWGLIYNPVPKSALKILYGEAFRAPNNYERYYTDNSAKPNPEVKPENIKTAEMILEQYIGDRFRLSVSGFLYQISGLISQQTDPADGLLTYRNVDNVESKGLEFEIETRLARGLEGRIGYTLQDTRDRQNKQTLTNSPRHLGKFNLSAPLWKQKLFAGLDLQYTSKRRTLAGTDAPAFWLANFTILSRQLLKGLDLSWSVYNLFDQKYEDPGSEEHLQNTIEQNGRNYRLKLNYRF